MPLTLLAYPAHVVAALYASTAESGTYIGNVNVVEPSAVAVLFNVGGVVPSKINSWMPFTLLKVSLFILVMLDGNDTERMFDAW